MKTCPTCHQNYDDNTLKFCLEDGSLLVAETASGMTLASGADATLVLPGHSTEQPPTITSPGFTPAARAAPPAANGTVARGVLGYALLVVAALIIGISAIAVAVIVTSGRQGSPLIEPGTTPTPSATVPYSTPTPYTYSTPESYSTPYRYSTPGSYSTPTPYRYSTPNSYSTPTPYRYSTPTP